MKRLHLLPGTWKVENQDTYETWQKEDNRTLIGSSYKIVGKKQKVLETLKVRREKNEVIYEATVPDQNNGQTIPFLLNQQLTDRLSFENPDHDFPKTIQYTAINDQKLLVEVMGDQGKGFSYYLIRQLPENGSK